MIIALVLLGFGGLNAVLAVRGARAILRARAARNAQTSEASQDFRRGGIEGARHLPIPPCSLTRQSG